MNYAQKANEEIRLAQGELDRADDLSFATIRDIALTYAQVHATLAVAYATLAVQAETRG